MEQKEILEALRGGGGVAYRADIELYISQEICAAAADEIERLRGALGDILNPLGKLKREADASGAVLNGMAYSIANDPGFMQRIAREALQRST